MKKYLKYIIPVLFFLLMLIDSHITSFFADISEGFYIANAHFLLLGALCASQVFSRKYMLIMMTVLGLIYDSYYIGIIGIYAVALPLVVFFMYSLSNAINMNIFTMFFGWIILITGYELYSLVVQLIFQFATGDTLFFVTRYLGPTLLLNMALFMICIIPFKKLFDNVKMLGV